MTTTTNAEPPQASRLTPADHPRLTLTPVPQPFTVTPDTLDGQPVVLVPLFGKGAGRSMVLDRDAWPTVRERWGSRWMLLENGHYRYVVSSRSAATKGSVPIAYLARLITEAKPGQVVAYQNGNGLDLRASNLLVLSPEEAAARRGALASQWWDARYAAPEGR